MAQDACVEVNTANSDISADLVFPEFFVPDSARCTSRSRCTGSRARTVLTSQSGRHPLSVLFILVFKIL